MNPSAEPLRRRADGGWALELQSAGQGNQGNTDPLVPAYAFCGRQLFLGGTGQIPKP